MRSFDLIVLFNQSSAFLSGGSFANCPPQQVDRLSYTFNFLGNHFDCLVSGHPLFADIVRHNCSNYLDLTLICQYEVRIDCLVGTAEVSALLFSSISHHVYSLPSPRLITQVIHLKTSYNLKTVQLMLNLHVQFNAGKCVLNVKTHV